MLGVHITGAFEEKHLTRRHRLGLLPQVKENSVSARGRNVFPVSIVINYLEPFHSSSLN